jgi:hypothetical protein
MVRQRETRESSVYRVWRVDGRRLRLQLISEKNAMIFDDGYVFLVQ